MSSQQNMLHFALAKKLKNDQHIGTRQRKYIFESRKNKQTFYVYIPGLKPIIVECSHLERLEVRTQDFNLFDAIDSDELAELLVFFSFSN